MCLETLPPPLGSASSHFSPVQLQRRISAFAASRCISILFCTSSALLPCREPRRYWLTMSSPNSIAAPSGSSVATAASDGNSDSGASHHHDTHSPMQYEGPEIRRPDSPSDDEATDVTSSVTRSEVAIDESEPSPEETIPTEQREAAASLREVFETSAPQRFPTRSSSMRAPTRLYPQRDEQTAQEHQTVRQPTLRHGSTQSALSSILSEIALPRWQPDAEVTYCPICQTQFNFFIRKHHCRLGKIWFETRGRIYANDAVENVAEWSVIHVRHTE